MNKKKLLQLNVTANWGSTGKIAEGIGLAAMVRGWESTIAYGRMMNPSQSQLIKVGSKIDPYLHYVRHRLLDQEGLGSKGATKKFIKEIDSLEPDIIHLHNIHDHWLNYPLLFDYFASIDTPIVWTFHDCWAFTGGCAHFENDNCFSWKQDQCTGNCPKKHRKAQLQFRLRKEKIGLIGSRLNIVCVSQWLADYANQSFLGGVGARTMVINNGIDINGVFTPNGRNKDRMILGVSNVWPAYKGLDDFVQLRNLLPENIKICIVGLSQEQVKTLPAGINGITRTANVAELADLYKRATVFVNPTYNDSFPTVNLEALACGTPVITYRTGGSPEAVDSETGIVIDKGEIESLAGAIMKVIDNPDLLPASACRARAEAHFDKNIQFGKYIDLYDSLSNKSK